MVVCPICSAPNRSNAKFCARCGYALTPQEAAPLSCPQCGYGNRRGAKHCAACGKVVSPARNWMPIVIGGVIIATCCIISASTTLAAVALISTATPTKVAAITPSETPTLTATQSASFSAPTITPTFPYTTTPTTPFTPTYTPTRPPTGLQVGNAPPDFALKDAVSNQTVTLSQFMEQPVLINFWATWCVPCRDEMPAIQRAYVQHQANRLVVLAVDDDEDQSLIVRFGRDYGLTFNLLLDPGDRVNNLYRIRAIPTSYFVDKGGVIRSMQIGSMTEAQIAYHLSKIIP